MESAFQKEREINGRRYETTILMLDDAERVLVKLGNMGGFAVASIQASGKGKGFEQLAGMLAQGIGGMLSQLKAADVTELRKTFAECSAVQLEPGGGFVQMKIAQTQIFRGNLSDMIAWLTFCLEVNFADFFDGLRAKFAEAIALALKPEAAPSASDSPLGSTGDDGDF